MNLLILHILYYIQPLAAQPNSVFSSVDASVSMKCHCFNLCLNGSIAFLFSIANFFVNSLLGKVSSRETSVFGCNCLK